RVRYVLRSDQSMNNLRASEAQLAEAQRLAELGNFTWRPAERTVLWSAQAARIFGADEGMAAISVRSILRRVPSGERAPVIRALRELRDAAFVKLDHDIVLPNGGIKHVCLRAEMVRDDRGEPLVRGTYQDITQRKQSEVALRLARDAAE